MVCNDLKNDSRPERAMAVARGRGRRWTGQRTVTDTLDIALHTVATADQSAELDALLWEVLWRPIGLPRDFRTLIARGPVETELVALDAGRLAGGAVLVHHDDRLELRHLAVAPIYQRQGVGQRLVRLAVDLACQGHPVETWARNTSVAFFERLGFEPVDSEWREAALFSDHGIRFRRMRTQP